jgi:hypothetical protein
MRIHIEDEDFWLDGAPTYARRAWNGHRIEGLLLNARMVQATFDDLNPATMSRWAYPDTGHWDPERNVQELIAMLPEYRRRGLLAITVNFQGGSPEGYSRTQPWENSACAADGSLRHTFAERMRRVLKGADANGMAVIVGYFYQGQDERLSDEAAVLRAVDAVTDFLLEGGFENVLVEVNNECNTRYEHAILQPGRVHELIVPVARPEASRRARIGPLARASAASCRARRSCPRISASPRAIDSSPAATRWRCSTAERPRAVRSAGASSARSQPPWLASLSTSPASSSSGAAATA